MEKIKQLEQTIQTYMEKEHIPGLAVAVWKDGETVYENGFGYADIDKKTAVTPNTIFGAASVTKSFTALVIMRLAKEGKLHIDDPIQQYLPDFTLQDDRYVEDITIKHVMSHTTGIATYKRIQSLNTFEEHLAYLKEVETPLLGKPGEYFCYNNDVFLLLGAVIEKVTGKDYRGVIEEMILKPYNMTRSTFYVDEVLQLDDVSSPYVVEGDQAVRAEWPKIGNYAVGGGIRTTVRDLVRYGKHFLTEDEMMRNSVHLIRGTISYGYGLQITEDYEGRTLIEHGGSQPGVSSNFGFIPEDNLVIALLMNVQGASAADIWLHVVNTFLDLPLQQKRMIQPHYELKHEAFEPFIGLFATGEESVVEIRANDIQLEAVIEGKVYRLRASNEYTLVIEDDERPIRFYFDENNEAWAILFGMRMFLRQQV